MGLKRIGLIAGRRLFATLALALLSGAAAAQSLSEQLESQANQQYHQLLDQAAQQRALAPDNYPELVRVRNIANRILPFAPTYNDRARQWKWEINLIGSKEVNAFCMPGGKIAVYTGLLRALNPTDDEIAIVLGHEITHALREHAKDQYMKSQVGGLVADVGGVLLGQYLGIDPRITTYGTRGLNALVQLHYSRNDETEADVIGLRLAAQAGFDPRAGVALWEKMLNATGGQPPQWLSNHPAGQNRIEEIRRRLPEVMPLYAQAVGRRVDQLPDYRSTPMPTPARTP